MLTERKIPVEVLRYRRKPRRASRVSSETRSLDNCNHLATSATKLSFAELLNPEESPRKKRIAQTVMHKRLCDSLEELAVTGKGSADPQEVTRGKKSVRRLKKWDAARDLRRLRNCQTEWIGFRAKCCGGKSVAVPIGCNHRLCPFCANSRLERSRDPARKLLEGMTNPAFLTLTVPNVRVLTREVLAELSSQWKRFQRSVELVGIGGIRSIEVTFNREEKTWHPHLHILFDSPYPITGIRPKTFQRLIARLEYSWLRVCSPAFASSNGRSETAFLCWEAERNKHGKGDPWNLENRRIIKLKGVIDGPGAVAEVMKYISKGNRFHDVPEAVGGFLAAVRSFRMIQRYGSFYNFQIERGAAETFLKCDCGKGEWERLGVYDFSSVVQSETGCWYLRWDFQKRHNWRKRGPTDQEE